MPTPYTLSLLSATENAVGLPKKIKYGNHLLNKFYVHGTDTSGYNQFWRVVYAPHREAIRSYYKNQRPSEIIHGWKNLIDERTSYHGLIVPWPFNTTYTSVYVPKAEIMLHAYSDGKSDLAAHLTMNSYQDVKEMQHTHGKYIVMVKFNQLSPGHVNTTDKTYGYATNDGNIKAGDFVAVMSPVTGVCAAEVVEVVERSRCSYNATKWIIGKIDLTAYKNREANEKRLREVRKELERKKNELVAKYDLQMIAEDSPEGEKLVGEYEALMKALGKTDY